MDLCKTFFFIFITDCYVVIFEKMVASIVDHKGDILIFFLRKCYRLWVTLLVQDIELCFLVYSVLRYSYFCHFSSVS